MLKPATFRIVSYWRIEGTIKEVADALSEPERFPEWWGDVYLSVKTITPGNAHSIGQTVAIRSKGWLPYRINWQATLVENHMPHTWTVEAAGDLVGRGVWGLVQDGPMADVTYDWQVKSDRLLFRVLAPFFRWLMVSNHKWAMAKGEAGLKAEVLRRRQAQLR